MARKKRTKGPAAPRKPLNPPVKLTLAEQPQAISFDRLEIVGETLPMRERVKDFGHYGCRHDTGGIARWKRGDRWWCGPCYDMRWGIRPEIDPQRQREDS